MRIEHLVFCLGLACGVMVDEIEDLDYRAQQFINERIVPILKKSGMKSINFDLIHMCHCSKTTGCDARTTGWVPNITELTSEEKFFWKDTCYTDGACYQKVQPHPEVTLYGCYDTKSSNMDTDFHDTAENTCQNVTNGKQVGAWICCDTGNWCANQTRLHLPPVSTTTFSGWIVPIGVVLVVVAGVIGAFVHFFGKKVRNFHWIFNKTCDTNRSDTTSRDIHGSNGSHATAESTDYAYSQGQTQSTFASNGISYPDGLPPNTIEMLMALEETSGSGCGPLRLEEKTIHKRIKLKAKIGSGRFGNVFRGEYLGDECAVKIFRSTDETAFNQEIAVYNLRMLRHNNILRFIGSDRIDKGYITEMWIITEFMDHGSLHDYLQKKTLSVPEWYVLMRSAINGLAFLHTSLAGQDENSCKPAIAHRDIKSRNIMVRKDGTCAIGDLGLSITLANKNGKVDPRATNPKCGTVRYLAPEILDDTMQSSCFESYQQADIYAFALVMWETLCRVEDGNVCAKDAETVIPYFEWSERDPSDATMKDIVCDRNLRPTEQENWKDNKEIREILAIMKACWNANPTARLQAVSVKMRLQTMHTDYEISEQHRWHQPTSSKSLSVAFNVRDEQIRTVAATQNIEMIPLATQRVHDIEKVENKVRNGGYMGSDESQDPLLR